ncbi:MAG: DUF3616 domain-containing protein [Hydrogenophilaceae bacterium]
MKPETIPMFQPLTGIYEPSAIQQLADGRFLVVEDEKQHPFSLVKLGPDGAAASTPLEQGWLDFNDAFWKLDDLEGLARDRSGNIYAITSHSRTGGGERKSRDKLVRFRIDGDRVVETRVVGGLKPALSATHPALAAAAKVRDVKADGGLNIEALEISADQQRLMIGLRSPLIDHRAIIVGVENVNEMFEAGAPPRISAALTTLDLGGNGIRGMAYLAALGGYLLIGGPVARERVQFQVWFWSGHQDEPAHRVSVPGLVGFEHAEGICPAIIDDRQRIVIVSDDGDRVAGRPARFLLLDPEQLAIAA